MAQRWKNDMDGLLIFVRNSLLHQKHDQLIVSQSGLFSAVVTAFVIESYKSLQEDTGDLTVTLLRALLEQGSGQTTTPFAQTSFTPESWAVRVNIFWILSLIFSLACALSATMVQQWAQNYSLPLEKYQGELSKQARLRAYLNDAIQSFRAEAVIEFIPVLLHISVFMFLVGLSQFIAPLNQEVFIVITVAICLVAVAYAGITILPIVYADSPFRTPISTFIWRIYKRVGLWDTASVDFVDRQVSAATPRKSVEKEKVDMDADEDFSAIKARDLRVLASVIDPDTPTELDDVIKLLPDALQIVETSDHPEVTALRQYVAETGWRLAITITGLTLEDHAFRNNAPEVESSWLKAVWAIFAHAKVSKLDSSTLQPFDEFSKLLQNPMRSRTWDLESRQAFMFNNIWCVVYATQFDELRNQISSRDWCDALRLPVFRLWLSTKKFKQKPEFSLLYIRNMFVWCLLIGPPIHDLAVAKTTLSVLATITTSEELAAESCKEINREFIDQCRRALEPTHEPKSTVLVPRSFPLGIIRILMEQLLLLNNTPSGPAAKEMLRKFIAKTPDINVKTVMAKHYFEQFSSTLTTSVLGSQASESQTDLYEDEKGS